MYTQNVNKIGKKKMKLSIIKSQYLVSNSTFLLMVGLLFVYNLPVISELCPFFKTICTVHACRDADRKKALCEYV